LGWLKPKGRPAPHITAGYTPGLLGDVTAMHARWYAEHWGFGAIFEAKVASDMADFLRALPHDDCQIWSVTEDAHFAGSIAIDGRQRAESGIALLHWFLISPDLRGSGIGKRLLGEAVNFSRNRQIQTIRLWTFAGLDAARHLYEQHGFRLVRESEATTWGKPVTEQVLELSFS